MVIAGYKSEDYRLDINRKPLSKKQSRLVLKDMGIGILKDWIEFQMFDALETIQKKSGSLTQPDYRGKAIHDV